jgi:hypothetical protein
MTEEEAKALLAGMTNAPDMPAGFNALTAASSPARDVPGLVPKPTFAQRNNRGLPIDETVGAPTLVRFGTALREKPEEKIAYLEGVYGRGNVRLADDGQPLVTTVDPATKQAKEITINEQGLTLKDIGTMAAYAPEFVGAAAGTGVAGKLLSKAPGWLRALGMMGGEAIGQETAGGLKELAVSEEPPDLATLARERAANVPVDMTISALMAGAGTVLRRGAAPFGGSATPERMVGVQAAKEMQVPLSLAEETGSSILGRVESTMGRLPGSSKYFEGLKQQKTERFKQIQAEMLGLKPGQTLADLPSDEAVGEQAIATIRTRLAPRQADLTTAQLATQTQINEEILNTLAKQTGPVRQLHAERVGGPIRTRAFAERKAFTDEADRRYTALYDLPGGRERILKAPGLADNAKQLLAELPPEKVQAGFVPTGIAGRLQTLADTAEDAFSLRDLVGMRTEVANMIAEGQAIPGKKTHYLNEMRKILTEAINEAADSAPTPQLKTAWKDANDFYAKGAPRFEEGNIARLFRDIESRAFVKDEDIVKGIGPSEYASFKKFLGEASPEFMSLKRALADEVYQSATLPGSELVEGQAFARSLHNFYEKNRSVAEDIFGLKEGKVAGTLTRLGQAMEATAKLDRKGLESVMSGQPRGIARALRNLADEQKRLDNEYRSKIVRDIAENKLGADFDADQFVNRFYDTANKSEVQSIMAQLNDEPEVLERLRKKVIEKIFYRAQRAIADADPSRLGRGELFRPGASPTLERVFGEEANKEKLQLILGNKTYKDFVNTAKVLRLGERSEAAFAGAGGLQAGMQVSGMLTGGVFEYASDFAKQFIGKTIYSNPAFRYWFSRRGLSPANDARLAAAMIASTPFIEAVEREFGPEQTEGVLGSLQQSIGRWEQAQPSPAEAEAEKRTRMEQLMGPPRVMPIPQPQP